MIRFFIIPALYLADYLFALEFKNAIAGYIVFGGVIAVIPNCAIAIYTFAHRPKCLAGYICVGLNILASAAGVFAFVAMGLHPI